MHTIHLLRNMIRQTNLQNNSVKHDMISNQNRASREGAYEMIEHKQLNIKNNNLSSNNIDKANSRSSYGVDPVSKFNRQFN